MRTLRGISRVAHVLNISSTWLKHMPDKQQFARNFSTSEIYECGAVLVSLLAYPTEPNDLCRALKTLPRLMRHRRLAAQIAMGFLQEAEGHKLKLIKGVARLSINQMSAHVAVGKTDTGNFKTRVCTESIPVIHLADATAVALKMG